MNSDNNKSIAKYAVVKKDITGFTSVTITENGDIQLCQMEKSDTYTKKIIGHINNLPDISEDEKIVKHERFPELIAYGISLCAMDGKYLFKTHNDAVVLSPQDEEKTEQIEQMVREIDKALAIQKAIQKKLAIFRSYSDHN